MAHSNKDNQVEDLLLQVENQTLKAMTSKGFKKYLQTFSKFHNYSFGNNCLILSQNPEAIRVAGFHTWSEVGRYVKKGEKGIQILIPRIKKVETQDKVTGKVEEEKKVFGYIVGHVFDQSQTDGKELPPPLKHELNAGGEVKPELWNNLTEFAKSSGVSFSLEKIDGNASGFYRKDNHSVVVDSELSPAHRFSVMVHELAHSQLHNKETIKELPHATKSLKELEAEAVAFVVCKRAGIDAGLDSAAYISMHERFTSPQKMLESFKSSNERIMRTSNLIIHNLKLEAVLKPTLGEVKKQQSGLKL